MKSGFSFIHSHLSSRQIAKDDAFDKVRFMNWKKTPPYLTESIVRLELKRYLIFNLWSILNL